MAILKEGSDTCVSSPATGAPMVFRLGLGVRALVLDHHFFVLRYLNPKYRLIRRCILHPGLSGNGINPHDRVVILIADSYDLKPPNIGASRSCS